VSIVFNVTSAHLGYSVPENGVKNVIKEIKYNQGYLATKNAKNK